MEQSNTPSCLSTPPSRGVLLAVLLLLVLAARAQLSPATWATRDAPTVAREAASGGEADRLLASTLDARDAGTLVASMRRLAGTGEAPDWMRVEALSALCEYFCVTEAADSLARRSAELATLAGAPFDCPLQLTSPATKAGGHWWVQMGAFSTETNAKAALKELGGKESRRVTQEGRLWKAQLGPFATRAAAERAAAALAKAGRLKEHRIIEAP